MNNIMMILMRKFWCLTSILLLTACAVAKPTSQQLNAGLHADMPPINYESAIYEVPVKAGVSYQDVIDSLKSLSQGMNYVNPANFNIAEQMKKRDIDPQGVKEVHTYCNLGLGTEIMLDHPEFIVFAPCRVAIYEKQGQLFLALDRPTFDLKSIKNPTERAKKSAQQLEDNLIQLIEKARRGDI